MNIQQSARNKLSWAQNATYRMRPNGNSPIANAHTLGNVMLELTTGVKGNTDKMTLVEQFWEHFDTGSLQEYYNNCFTFLCFLAVMDEETNQALLKELLNND